MESCQFPQDQAISECITWFYQDGKREQKRKRQNGKNRGRPKKKEGGISLAGQEPHHIPVSGENAELHQVAENTENLQQELLKRWIECKYITISLMSLN